MKQKYNQFILNIVFFGEIIITILLINMYYLLNNNWKYIGLLGFFNIGKWFQYYYDYILKKEYFYKK